MSALKCWICGQPAFVGARGEVVVSIMGALCRECLTAMSAPVEETQDTREHELEAGATPRWGER